MPAPGSPDYNEPDDDEPDDNEPDDDEPDYNEPNYNEPDYNEPDYNEPDDDEPDDDEPDCDSRARRPDCDSSSPTGNRKYWDDTGKFQPQKSHHRDLHHNWREKVYFCKLLPKQKPHLPASARERRLPCV